MLKLSNITFFGGPCFQSHVAVDDLLGAGSLWWPSGEFLRIATAGWATGEVWSKSLESHTAGIHCVTPPLNGPQDV